jgi:hypothetical protein
MLAFDPRSRSGRLRDSLDPTISTTIICTAYKIRLKDNKGRILEDDSMSNTFPPEIPTLPKKSKSSSLPSVSPEPTSAATLREKIVAISTESKVVIRILGQFKRRAKWLLMLTVTRETARAYRRFSTLISTAGVFDAEGERLRSSTLFILFLSLYLVPSQDKKGKYKSPAMLSTASPMAMTRLEVCRLFATDMKFRPPPTFLATNAPAIFQPSICSIGVDWKLALHREKATREPRTVPRAATRKYFRRLPDRKSVV